jgi:hypothetical protein
MSWEEGMPQRTLKEYESRFNYLYSLGYEMMTYEERYFRDTGRYYEDDYPSEDEEEEVIEEENEDEYDYEDDYY